MGLVTVSAEPLVGPSGLSPSSLDTWLQCPSKFRKEKIERRESPSGIDAFMGTYVHLVLERLFIQPMRHRTIEEARRVFQGAWEEIQAEDDFTTTGLAAGTPEEQLAFQRRVWASVRSYFDTENPTHVDVVATEQKLGAVIEGVPIRGIVDRIDRDAFDDLVITDYKAGKVPAPMFQGPKLRQLNLYAALVDEIMDEQPTDGRLVFTTHQKVIHTRFTPQSVHEAVECAVTAWDEIQLALAVDLFPTGVGPLCGWCPFIGECDDGVEFLVGRMRDGKLKKTAPAWDLIVAAKLAADTPPGG